jgi:hypothetical protein
MNESKHSPFNVPSSGSTAPERQQSTVQNNQWDRKLTEPEAGLTATEQALVTDAERVQLHPQEIESLEFHRRPATAAEKAALVKADAAAQRQQEQLNEFMRLWGDLETMDWKKIPPHKMAVLLTLIPRKGRKDEPDYYLNYNQALIFAIEAYRMDLSPLSDQCFFVRETFKVNATLSGKKHMSRGLGMNFGPPKFERLEKPFTKGKSVPGFTQDLGYRCSMQIKGFEDRAEYTAWISEWYVSTSPVWREKPEHMLQTRAQEKAISSASGVGASEMPHANDIEPVLTGPPQVELLPSFTQAHSTRSEESK